MHAACLWLIPTFPARAGCAQTKVRFLEIEEVFFVKQTDLAQHLAAQHDAGSGDPIDARGTGGQRRSNHIGVKQPGDRAEPSRAFKFTSDGWETESRGMGQVVLAAHMAADDPDAGVGLKMGQKGRDTARIKEGIRVYHMHKIRHAAVRHASAQGDIIACSEAAVLACADQAHAVPCPPASLCDSLFEQRR